MIKLKNEISEKKKRKTSQTVAFLIDLIETKM